ncbi:protein BREAST CANCER SUSCEPTIBILITY 1 [Salvia divinorum]|uniref:Protein BREAST CANCER SUSCEPTIBILITY 1 n=1 Tax=Salvia divinorum TaxID=28513 RepID=A0ABD1HHY9_SALDI
MADASHLERMGRELKCPICLSLFNSAVSLTCNHVFCNLCIEKSMKASSSCPVCKVPYRRREIRPAPHMDNLVSVYKSMEVASGVSIFNTQTEASTGPSVQNNGQKNPEASETGNKKLRERRGSKSASVFPTKKRVQVSPYRSTRTEMEREKLNDRSSEINRKETKSSHVLQNNMPSTCEKGGAHLPPFFWLRDEEDMENSSQQTNDNLVMYTPPEAPCFSDIKDSDDERGDCNLSNNVDFFDSEMFDWTQRPCSPELCSTPPTIQIEEHTAEEDVALKSVDATSTETAGQKNRPHSAVGKRKRAKISESKGRTRTSNKKANANEPEKDKKAKSISEVTAVRAESGNVIYQDMQEGNKDTPLIQKGKSREGKKVLPDASLQEKDVLSLSDGVEPLAKGKGAAFTQVSASKICGKSNGGRMKAKSISKVTAVRAELGNVIYQDIQEGAKDTPMIRKGKSREGKKVLSDASVQEKDVLSLSDGAESLASSKGAAFTQVSASEIFGKSNEGRTKSKKSGEDNKNSKKPTQLPKSGSKEKTKKSEIGKKVLDTEQDKEGLISQLLTNPPGIHEEVLDECVKRKHGKICRKSPSSAKKVKFSVQSMCKDNHGGTALGANEKDATTDNLFEDIQLQRDLSDMKTPSKFDKQISPLSGHALLKCNTSPSTICCAFCQSSEESEASGIMVHYVGGKLVMDDARKNVIHVHKNCAEWAPNVYFEDDTVVNLENELSRSRRIRCCCCGIKGAALGCYDKSCRKSFHVPCARLTPECRWDSENFVMLCPIHKASQLPNDTPQSQARKNSKSSAERKSCIHQDKVKTNEECKDRSPSQWKSQKTFKNLVLCCSALINTEKETVTEFENLSGVTILKNWDSTVTHVIASTDENGACRRTLKFLMGVLEGKWILSVQWIKACIEAGGIADEEQFEISVDIHGIRNGPKLGRLRLLNKQPKLFDGYTYYLMGDFTPSYRGYLHDLVIAAGGKVLNRKPVAGSSETTFIVYSVELPEQCKPSNSGSVVDQRRASAEALASSAGARVTSNSWIMNSIAGYKLQTVSK